MSKFLCFTIVFGALSLLVALFYIARLNWEQAQTPVLSVLAGSLVTILVAVFSSLKSVDNEKSVLVDSEVLSDGRIMRIGQSQLPGLAVDRKMITPRDANGPLSGELESMDTLVRSENSDMHQNPALSVEEMAERATDGICYFAIIKFVEAIDGSTQTLIQGGTLQTLYKPSLNIPRGDPITEADYFRNFKGNFFAEQRARWEDERRKLFDKAFVDGTIKSPHPIKTLRLPNELHFRFEKGSKNESWSQVIFERKNFYRIVVKAEPLQSVSRVKSYGSMERGYLVSLNAHFYALTAGNVDRPKFIAMSDTYLALLGEQLK